MYCSLVIASRVLRQEYKASVHCTKIDLLRLCDDGLHCTFSSSQGPVPLDCTIKWEHNRVMNSFLASGTNATFARVARSIVPTIDQALPYLTDQLAVAVLVLYAHFLSESGIPYS